MTKPFPALLLLSMLAASARAAETIQLEPTERSDDPPPMAEIRDRLFGEARPDPLRKGYEELFAEPYPDVGWHPFARFKPFEDVQKFNEAVDRKYFEPIPTMLAEQGEKVQVQVKLPEGQAGALDVWVNRGRVLLSYAPTDQPPGKWRYYKRREHSLPLPESVDPKSAQITREGDVLTITFTKSG